MSEQGDLRSPLSAPQRDYLLMTIFVLVQNGKILAAKQIVDGLLALGERSTNVRTAEAVLAFLSEEYSFALNCLDRLDSDLREGEPLGDEVEHLLQYLRARCYYSVGRKREAGDIVAQITAVK